MNRKKDAVLLCAGILVGAALVGPAARAVDRILAERSVQAIYVDGKQVEMEAYAIGGHNYIQLRDVGRAVDFGVTYDGATNSVRIDTTAPYTEEAAPSTAPDGVITVPQSDEPFRPLAGDVVLLDDGTTFTVTEPKDEEPPLPTATCDWSQFPDIELPTVQAKRGGSGAILVLNLYETRRMQYTLYNAVATSSEVWQEGTLKLSSKGNPLFRLKLGIQDFTSTQVFWPWRDEQLTQVFYALPIAQYEIVAWDSYNSDGKFMFTKYYLKAI